VQRSRIAVVTILLMYCVSLNARADDLQSAPTLSVQCTPTAGNRQRFHAGKCAGVVRVKSTGPAECLLGKAWGYDATGVWVSDGCNAEFLPGAVAAAAAPAATRS